MPGWTDGRKNVILGRTFLGHFDMRNPYISFLQAFGILLVAVGHAFPTDGHDAGLYRWIYSFHMPLWIFLSGYLLRYTAAGSGCTASGSSLVDIPVGAFVAKKARRLLVPYFLISTLVFLPKVWLSRWAVKPVELSWDAYFEMLLVPSKNVIVYYWFLPTIFLLLVGTVLAARGLRRLGVGDRVPLWGWALATLALSVFNPLDGVGWLNLSGVVKSGFFFVLGIVYCAYQREIDEGLALGSLWALAGWGATSVLATVTGYGVVNPLAERLTAVCGILFALSLGRFYLRSGWRFLAPLDGATYAIFLFSWFPQSALRVVLYDWAHLDPWIGVPVSTAAGVAVPWLVWRGLLWAKRWRVGRILAAGCGQ
ncbi:acyltransferase [uncultured Rikenella sp.]|uniref:acyltransferase family protein n=2 Tax=uncultured Rikenella sp. TaxID=368003 RepID=UPI002610B0EE|nr:acyltransferase [uncultured Rikenella sp.]